MGAGCAQCGSCCEAIVVDKPKSNWAYGDPSRGFVNKHWHPISRAEVLKRNPNIPEEELKGMSTYECDKYNKETHQCMAGWEKPYVCTGFPWYTGQPEAQRIRWWPKCSYWHDLPKQQWLAGTDPLPDPNVPKIYS